jgi:hypothetical protein
MCRAFLQLPDTGGGSIPRPFPEITAGPWGARSLDGPETKAITGVIPNSVVAADRVLKPVFAPFFVRCHTDRRRIRQHQHATTKSTNKRRRSLRNFVARLLKLERIPSNQSGA